MSVKISQKEFREILDEVTSRVVSIDRSASAQEIAKYLVQAASLDTNGAKKPTYKSLFYEETEVTTLNNDGFSSFKEFLHAAISPTGDTRLKDMSEGSLPDGGYLVPEEFESEVFNIAIEESLVMPRAKVYGMKSPTKKIPAFEIGSHANHLYGGVVARWMAEKETASKTSPKFRLMNLQAKKLGIFGKASSEVAADGLSFEDQIRGAFDKSLAWYLDDSFINGSGAGQPLGVLNAPCTIAVSKESGQSANTITYPNLVNMLAHLHPASWKNAIWLAHPTTIPQLLTLSVTVGSGGSWVKIFDDKTMQSSILGRPVYFTEKCSTLGTQGDIILADFSQYGIGLMKNSLRFERSNAVNWDSDELDYRLLIRVDGQPLWDSALTLKDGSTTVSPFVVIETRS